MVLLEDIVQTLHQCHEALATGDLHSDTTINLMGDIAALINELTNGTGEIDGYRLVNRSVSVEVTEIS